MLEDGANTAATLKKKPNRKGRSCWICQKILYSAKALTRHIQAHTGEKTFPCDHCDRYFANEEEQQNHLRFLNLERRFKCDQCGKAFKRKCLLNIHLIRHGSERPFSVHTVLNRTSLTRNYKSIFAFTLERSRTTAGIAMRCLPF